jgi:flagellar operon protein
MHILRQKEFTISMAKINNFLVPNINQLPSQNEKVDSSNKLKSGTQSEFKDLINNISKPEPKSADFNLSGHAVKRLQERNIEMDSQEYLKLKEAFGKLRNKGGHDSLIITNKAAYIVDVDKNMVVTAVDKNQMSDNVFTKIDSTIFMM